MEHQHSQSPVFAKDPQFDRSRHGGLHDRGAADAWYGRAKDPHWYPAGSYYGEKITKLTPEEIAEYMHGYDNQQERKEW